MESLKPEVMKLDLIDRKVLFWLTTHESQYVLKHWINYVAKEYAHHEGIMIDGEKLFAEILIRMN